MDGTETRGGTRCFWFDRRRCSKPQLPVSLQQTKCTSCAPRNTADGPASKGWGSTERMLGKPRPPPGVIPDVSASALSFPLTAQQLLSNGSGWRNKLTSQHPLLPTLETLGFPRLLSQATQSPWMSSSAPVACSPPLDDLQMDVPCSDQSLRAVGPIAFPTSPLNCPIEASHAPTEWPPRNSSRSLPQTETHRDPPKPHAHPQPCLCQIQSSIQSCTGSSGISPDSPPSLRPYRHLWASGSQQGSLLYKEHPLRTVWRRFWLSQLERGGHWPLTGGEPRDAADHPTMHRTGPAQGVSTAEGESPCRRSTPPLSWILPASPLDSPLPVPAFPAHARQGSQGNLSLQDTHDHSLILPQSWKAKPMTWNLPTHRQLPLTPWCFSFWSFIWAYYTDFLKSKKYIFFCFTKLR